MAVSETTQRWTASSSVHLTPRGSWHEDGYGSVEFVSFAIGDDDEDLKGTTKDCSAAFDGLHRELAVQVGGDVFSVLVSPIAVTTGEVALFSAKGLCERLLAEEVSCRTDFMNVQWSLLSVVGPVVALRIFESDAGAGGPPYHHESWLTFDLRTNLPAKLDAIVTEESLMAALKAHAYFDEAIDSNALRRLKAATTLQEVLAAWGTNEMRSYGEWGGYAFHGGNDDAAVTMRLGFRQNTAGLSLNHLDVLELKVQPKPEAKRWFEAARRGDGHIAPP